ncbi:MAG: heavy metal translocating P-type ATPase [Bradymonadaceae bacterium]
MSDADQGHATGASEEPSGEAWTLVVPEMDCPSCGEKVTAVLDEVERVRSVDARPASGTVELTVVGTEFPQSQLEAAVEAAGYSVADVRGEDDPAAESAVAGSDLWTSRRAVETAVSGVLVAAGLVLEFAVPSANAPSFAAAGRTLLWADAIFLAAVAVGGRSILANGLRSARKLHLDIDFLMSVAILGAVAASVGFGERFYFEAATLACLFGFAELLERRSMDRARQSLRELMELSPDRATVRREDGSETIPVGDVEVGDIVVVRPGEKVPVDGEVVEGESALDQSPITGESVPVAVEPGDEVYAGSINDQGYLEIETTAAAGRDTLSQIVRMVEDAQSKKTEREQFVERFASYYTPAVVAFAVLTTAASPAVLGVTWATAVVYGLTLLVLACPCAFVISTPVSVVSGVTSAAEHGVLIKGGRHLEAMSEVDVVVFDKTGTLTEVELTVTDVIPLAGRSEEEVLQCALGAEQRSEHPIGEAIVAHARRRRVVGPQVDAFTSLTGKGVRADLDGTPHYAGKPTLFDELGFDLSHVHATTDEGVVSETARALCERNNCLDLIEETVPRLQSEGKTVVLVGTEDALEGVVALADRVRPAARRAVDRLKGLGVERTVMLTGDNERSARAVAEEVGIDEVRAALLPDEKVRCVRQLVDESDGVAMVGDGVNDAPALATATVGIAMGAAGTDTAIETADIALMSDDLSRLPYLYELALSGNRVIRQNIWSSLGVKAALAAAVPTGYVPIWLAVLAGDAGMTVGVTGNAMRLARVRPDSHLAAKSGES